MASTLSQVDIQTMLCGVVQSVTGWPTVQGDQDAPTSKGSYFMLRVINTDTPAHDVIDEEDVAGTFTETARGQSYLTAEFIALGNGAMDICKKAISGLQSNQRLFDLWNSIGLCGFGPVQNLSEAYGGMFRQKAVFNMDFYANLSYGDSEADYTTNGTIELIVPPLIDKTFTVQEF